MTEAQKATIEFMKCHTFKRGTPEANFMGVMKWKMQHEPEYVLTSKQAWFLKKIYGLVQSDKDKGIHIKKLTEHMDGLEEIQSKLLIAEGKLRIAAEALNFYAYADSETFDVDFGKLAQRALETIKAGEE